MSWNDSFVDGARLYALPPAQPHPACCDNSDDDDAGRGRGQLPLILLFSALATLYQFDPALGQIIKGEASDGYVSVRWEYDLQRLTGDVTLVNIDYDPEPGEDLYFDDVIPGLAKDLFFNPDVVHLQRCTLVSATPYSAFVGLRPGEETVISFKLPPPTWSEGLAPRELEYGHGVTLSAPGCLTIPTGQLDNFVTVTPVTQPCHQTGDFDGDQDVDLRDFAEFQRRYTGPGGRP